MKKEFEEKGYIRINSFFSDEEIGKLRHAFNDVVEAIYLREINGHPNLLKWQSNIDAMINKLYEKDKNLIGEVYDTFAYSAGFLRFITTEKLQNLITQLTGSETLYCSTNRCRIDPPHDTRRTYGWHQEVFYTIPESNFIQTWAPLFRNTTIKNGTIEILEGSHKEGIAQQSWIENPGGAHQIIVDESIVKKYKPVQLEMNVGDLLLFSGKTIHRSGYNSSNEIRYSLVGMYHNISGNKAQFPKPNFEWRGKTPKEYYEEVTK